MALTILPNAGQTLGQTRDPIRGNFQAIDAGFSVNHIDFASGADSGKHYVVTFPQQAADPVPGTGATEIQIFAKVDANTTGGTGLFLKTANNPVSYSITAGSNMANGWTRLPAGMLLQWGTFQTVAGNTGTGTIFPFPKMFANVFTVSLTAADNGNNTTLMVIKTINVNNFTAYSRSGNDGGYTTANFYFFAVGN